MRIGRAYLALDYVVRIRKVFRRIVTRVCAVESFRTGGSREEGRAKIPLLLFSFFLNVEHPADGSMVVPRVRRCSKCLSAIIRKETSTECSFTDDKERR